MCGRAPAVGDHAACRRRRHACPRDELFVNHSLQSVSCGLQCSHDQVVETEVFQKWLTSLRDRTAKVRIIVRLRRASTGNFGDWKAVGGGVAEMRIDHGPGYRVYFARRGDVLIIILGGGTKRTQAADIGKAIEIVRQME